MRPVSGSGCAGVGRGVTVRLSAPGGGSIGALTALVRRRRISTAPHPAVLGLPQRVQPVAVMIPHPVPQEAQSGSCTVTSSPSMPASVICRSQVRYSTSPTSPLKPAADAGPLLRKRASLLHVPARQEVALLHAGYASLCRCSAGTTSSMRAVVPSRSAAWLNGTASCGPRSQDKPCQI